MNNNDNGLDSKNILNNNSLLNQGVNSQNIDQSQMQPQGFNSQAIDQNQIQPQIFNSQAIDQNQIQPQSFNSQAIDPNQVQPQDFNSQFVDSSQVQPQNFNSQFVDSNQVQSQSFNSQFVDPNQMQPQNFNSQAIDLGYNTNNSYMQSDDELLRAFIGKNYEKITTRKFNFAGFFFTSFYMFYRKMFVYGLLLFILNFIILNFTNWIVYFIFCVVLGFFTNKIYLYFANKQIAKIKTASLQNNIGQLNLKDICTTKGGTSVGKIFLGIAVEIAITIAILVLMLLFGITLGMGSVINELFKATDEETSTSSNSTYNGVLITDTSVNVADVFSITVPSAFQNSSSNYTYQYEYSSGAGVFDSCKVRLEALTGFDNGESLINQMAAYYGNGNPIDVNELNINGTNWYWIFTSDSFGTTYYYGTTKNNKAFLLIYDINKDAGSDCEGYRQQIINSVGSKY